MVKGYNKYRYVYDDSLAYYLKTKGHRFITHARHITTNKEFFQYENSSRLENDINEWNNNINQKVN